ncbi:MAG: B3/4 domain-containing protein [Vicinamibacterales bacterium]
MTTLSLAAGVTSFVAPSVAIVAGAQIAQRMPNLDVALDSAATQLRDLDAPPPSLMAVRAMYRRFGVDPTKTRPSSEALLRRIRKGEPLPRINAAVDIGNWCSVETQLPFGLYDAQRLVGDGLVLRIGAPSEEYHGIRNATIHVAGRLVMADDLGPFGNPTADSARTMVNLQSSSILVVVYAPAACAQEGRAALTLATTRLRQYCGAEIVWTWAGAAG